MSKRQAQQQRFLELLKRMNPAQRQAVEQIEGPVLAIAGPGTGKTHILTARVGQILKQTDAQAHNILCLTFTDAGVQAMRERLLTFIGADAQRVHIYTFHSFCHRIIQDHLDRFGHHDLRPLSDLERVDLIRELLEQTPPDHPFHSSKGAFFYEKPLQELFQRLKAEGWTVQDVEDCIVRYLEDLPKRPDYLHRRNNRYGQAGTLRKERYEEECRRMERLRQALALFEAYQQALETKHRYDYEDMLLWVLDLFEQDEYILRLYQEQYLYVLVDEFQDTNGAQNALIHRLMDYWEDNPNLFIVGDDDQAIFEFQGARLAYITDFYHRYRKHLHLVLLQDNYRSAPSILRAAERLIRHNENRLRRRVGGVGKTLRAANPEVANIRRNVHIYAWPNKREEEAGLVRQIKALHKQGIPLSDMAILYAQHRQAEGLVRLLEQEKIPYRSRRRVNILDQALVRQVINFLHCVVNPYAELWYEVLHASFLGLHPKDLRYLFWWQAQQAQTWPKLLESPELWQDWPWENLKAWEEFAAFWFQVQEALPQMPLVALLELVFSRSGLLAYVQTLNDAPWQMETLYTLFEFARLETEKDPHLSLAAWLDILQRMADYGLALTTYRETHGFEGLQLLTVHSAKGLEFPYVFMVHCLERYWEQSGNQIRHFTLPDTLTASLESDGLEAARRLFYVAMTRAQKRLQLSYHEEDESHKPTKPTRFLAEIQADGKYATQSCRLEASVMQAWFLKQMTEVELPPSQQLERERVAGLLQKFKLTASALNTYLACPLAFYYEYILKLPSGNSPEAAYGTAWHEVLKRLFDVKIKHQRKDFPSNEQAALWFEEALNKQRHYFSSAGFKSYLEQGLKHWPLYLAQRRDLWREQLRDSPQVYTEKVFRQIEWEGIPLLGIIDKLELSGSAASSAFWRITDYKTGKHEANRLEPPTAKQPQAGAYYRQLLFYKLLLEQSPFFHQHRVKELCLDYLSPDDKGGFPQKRLSVGVEEGLWIKDLVKEVYGKIEAQIFSPGCGKPSCKWCALAARQHQAEHYRNEWREELDDFT